MSHRRQASRQDEHAPRTVSAPPVAALLRALREGSGISQDGWAARLGYSRKTVHRWEHGATVPDHVAEAAILTVGRELGLFGRVAVDARTGSGTPLTEAVVREALAAARVSGRAAIPPLRPLPLGDVVPAHSSTLPVPRTSLIGRTADVAAVVEFLGPDRSRRCRQDAVSARRR